jgi:hypothetical protein
LKSIVITPTDANWNVAFVTELQKVAHKKLDLHSFSIYWEHSSHSLLTPDAAEFEVAALRYCRRDTTQPLANVEFIVEPVNAKGKLKRSKQGATLSSPHVSLEFEIDNISLRLTSSQLRDLFNVKANVSRIQLDLARKEARFEHIKWLRPTQALGGTSSSSSSSSSSGVAASALPKSKVVRAWWAYALTCVLETTQRDRGFRFDWDLAKRRRGARQSYMTLWIAYRTVLVFPSNDLKTLERLEELLSQREISLFRSLADANVANDPALTSKVGGVCLK